MSRDHFTCSMLVSVDQDSQNEAQKVGFPHQSIADSLMHGLAWSFIVRVSEHEPLTPLLSATNIFNVFSHII